MAENMMNSAHKSSNDKYRDGWERTFREPFIKAQPPSWNGDFLKIYTENGKGKGKTILCYGSDKREIIMSEKIGILQNTKPIVKKDHVIWESAYGKVATDGKVVERINDKT